MQLGRALAFLIRNGSHRHRVVIGKDTRLSGYMLEQALAAGHHLDGGGRGAGGPAAHPRHRQHHHLDARRRRRGHLRLAQPLPGQRHQVLLARRLQAPGRDRGEARGAGHQRADRRDPPHRGQDRPRGAARRRPGPLHRVPEEHLPPRADAGGDEDRRRLRARRRVPDGAGGARGARGDGHLPRLRAERPEHQRRGRRGAPRVDGPGGGGARRAPGPGAGWRRRPAHRRRREGPHRRRRRDHGDRAPASCSPGTACAPGPWSPR